MQSKTIGLPSYNIRKKTYSDGSVELTSYSLIRKRHKLENQEKIIKPKTDIAIKTDRQKYGKTVAQRIRDYGLSNKWDYFFTLTFSPEKIDRFDYEKCCKAFSLWLKKTQTRQKRAGLPSMKYIAVPEFHKAKNEDGKSAVHFHLLVSDFYGDLEETVFKHRKIKNGKAIYSSRKGFKILDWEKNWGFGTAQKIEGIIDKETGELRNGSRDASLYLSKYCSKFDESPVFGKKGAKFYWCSKGLKKPEVDYLLADVDVNLKDSKPSYTSKREVRVYSDVDEYETKKMTVNIYDFTAEEFEKISKN